jgi:hypothetical protein
MNISLSDVLSLLPFLDSAWGAILSVLMWAVHNPAKFILGDIVFTWAFYLAMCSLKRAHTANQIPKFLKPLAYVLLAGFLVADCVFNLIVGTIVFLQFPRQWLFTERCKANQSRWDWRRDAANWWCANWLNPFDPSGRHC